MRGVHARTLSKGAVSELSRAPRRAEVVGAGIQARSRRDRIEVTRLRHCGRCQRLVDVRLQRCKDNLSLSQSKSALLPKSTLDDWSVAEINGQILNIAVRN